MDEHDSDPLLSDDDVPVEIIREQIRLSMAQATLNASRPRDIMREAFTEKDGLFQGRLTSRSEPIIELKPPQIQRKSGGRATGYRDVNRILGGFHRGELITVSALPSSGTSTFLQNVARKVASQPHPAEAQPVDGRQKNAPVSRGAIAYFSLDVTRAQIASRLTIAASKINPRNPFSGISRDPDDIRLAQVAERLLNARLNISDEREITTKAIFHACENLKRQSGLDLIIIDRADIVGVDGGGMCPPLFKTMEALKKMAQELDVPVLASCLIDHSRVDEANFYRPRIKSLPSAAASYADVVTTLHRPENWIPRHLFAEDRDRSLSGITQVQKGIEVLEFTVLHQVSGGPETARLAFNKEWCRIDNILWDDV